MQNYLGALSIVLLLGTVMSRALVMKKNGMEVMQFGKNDKSDFAILPFALFCFYTIFGAAFNWPIVSNQEFFNSEAIAWGGVFLCLLGILMLVWSIVSFGESFRVGIDEDHPAELVTTGAFAISRNPIYVGFFFLVLGQFLIFSNWILLIFLVGATWLFNRQSLREEEFLKGHYGANYAAYCDSVRRYL